MPSSTSPFENPVPGGEKLQRGLRLTASDRPGQAQPVPQRDIPAQPWAWIAAAVFLILLVAFGIWEWQMRKLELAPGFVTDDSSAWAVQRRRVATERVAVAIVGDSRILFDTDLDRFAALTGVRPLQLALVGTNARPFVEDLAADPNFNGLLIVGITETSYFREDAGLMGEALKVGKWESPARRASFQLGKYLSGVSASFDDEYRLSVQLRQLDRGLRPGARSPYEDVWKLSNMGADRQMRMWHRIETDPYLRGHARHAWESFRAPRVDAKIIAKTYAVTARAVAAIRARGGEVVFVRPPSAPHLRAIEDGRLSRATGWDGLLGAAKVRGIHADDLPAARGLPLPEYSHLNAACATVFTDAYVRALSTLTARLAIRPLAPPPLAPSDCNSALKR